MTLVRPVEPTDISLSPPPPEDMAGLLVDLSDESPPVRRRAAHNLARTGEPQAIAALCARAGVETDETVLETILTMVMGCRGRATVEGLLPYLASDNPSLRNGVADVLRAMPEAIGPHVEEVLSDHDPAVRIMGIGLLAGLPDPRVSGWLVEVIGRDDDFNVCAAAVDVLAEVGEPAALPALKRLPTRFPGVPFLEFAIHTAVSRIGNGEGKRGAP
ncbi:MAG: HEAT repeat domain-containing protein [Alphaproteobacteria bacterium]|nr:HEAT repeat domain-containing protein [Alphaproteobacteria bacterium]